MPSRLGPERTDSATPIRSTISVSRSDTRYDGFVIKSFRHKGLEALYTTGSRRGIQSDHVGKLTRILAALDAAHAPVELNLPSYRLHELKGSEAGTWSIQVNGNWRVTFRFDGPDVEQIDYLDYH
jgi:proteic killer suppression protein